MSDGARFFLAIGDLLDRHEELTGMGRLGCIRPDLLTYWLARQREDAAWLIGFCV
jgi:hypothetical protein